MNRVAVWILGAISGIMLFFGLVMISGVGIGSNSDCTSYGTNPPPCTPILQQITIAYPLGGGALTFLLLAILIGLPAWIASPILAQRRGSSARTVILIVSIIASAFMVVSLITPFVSSPALTSPQTCLALAGPSQTCYYGDQAKLAALIGIGIAPLLASLLLGLPAYVMALTETARRKRWGWFAAVLVFSPIAAMLYGFFGAQPHLPVAPPAPTLAASGA